MGAGIAKGIRSAFPEAYEADQKTEKGDRRKLGTCSVADLGKLKVVNCYTQFDFRGRGTKVDYEAVRSYMAWIKENYPDLRIGLPLIGAGLAGGDWERIKGIMKEELEGQDVTIVHYRA
jgi:O-acetyl-ADP-ribose deacetylase (regulator of RNase III)